MTSYLVPDLDRAVRPQGVDQPSAPGPPVHPSTHGLTRSTS